MNNKRNAGYCNTGDGNAGNCNAGYCNTGDWNNGNCNTGNSNTGNGNAGDWNTGNWNAGYCNAGYCNTGDWNNGNCNAGYCNTGNGNAGNWNTGNCNTGDWNAGDWNAGNCNNGYCNSITPEDCLIFNKPAKRSDWENARKPQWMYIDLIEWILGEDMTDKEKEAYPSYVTTGGYLKCYSSLKEAYIESWEKASKEDKELTFKLPNFDIEVFKEVFGFTPVIDDKVKIICEGKEVFISRESAIALNLIKEEI